MSHETRPTLIRAGLGIAVVAGLLLRLVDLENRPIHHDEAVNWYFVSGVLRNGWYDYDPSNYHGPLLFQIGALFRALLGGELWVERLPGALMGAAMPAMMWPLRRWLGTIGTITAAFCLALSPTLVFFSRDHIHEIWLAAGSIGAVAAMASTRRHDPRVAALAGVSIGLMITMKETVIIVVCAWIVGLVSSWLFSGKKPPELPYRPMAAAAVAMTVLSYTSFFQRPEDLVDLAETLNLWGPRGVDGDGHNKPWTYFGELLGLWEGPTMLLAGIGSLWALVKRDRVGVFLAGWAWSTVFVYSIISYKTPWLILQLITPMTLLAGLGAQVLPRQAGWAALVIAMAGLGWRTVELSFDRYDDPSTKLAYVQNRREHHALMTHIQQMKRDDGEKLNVRSVYSARYPINWYMRGIGVNHAEEPWPASLDGDVLLSHPKDAAKVHGYLSDAYWQKVLPFRGHMKMMAWVHTHHPRPGDDWKRIEPIELDFEPPEQPTTLVPGWRVQWFKGTLPSGEPADTVVTDTIDYKWTKPKQKHIPAPFYVRHTGWIEVTGEGPHRFVLDSDDGSRLWVDGSLIVDNWGDHPTERSEGTVELSVGRHHVQLDVFDVGGVAELKLQWAVPGGAVESIPAGAVGTGG